MSKAYKSVLGHDLGLSPKSVSNHLKAEPFHIIGCDKAKLIEMYSLTKVHVN